MVGLSGISVISISDLYDKEVMLYSLVVIGKKCVVAVIVCILGRCCERVQTIEVCRGKYSQKWVNIEIV